MVSPEMMPIVEGGMKIDKSTPPHVRVDFILKVYGVVIAMLLVSFGIAAPFVFYEDDTVAFFKDYPFILGLCALFLNFFYIINMCMFMEILFGGSHLQGMYLRMFVTTPWNYLFLFSFAACFGVCIGFVCTAYTASSVVFVFLLSAAIIVALTVYAMRTEADFTGMGAYILVALLALFLLQILALVFPVSEPVHRMIAALGAMIFGFNIVWDTQLIFGEASTDGKELQYTIDMWAFAAFALYLDFINFFLQMLRFLGERS